MQRWPGECVERGIEGSRWHHLCCVVFYHWQSSKEGLGLGLPTWSRGRDTGKQAYRTSLGLARVKVQSAILRFCVSSEFIIEHNEESQGRLALLRASRVKSQESSPESRPRNFARNARSVCISDRSLCAGGTLPLGQWGRRAAGLSRRRSTAR